jgi:Uma2 family endonuclease
MSAAPTSSTAPVWAYPPESPLNSSFGGNRWPRTVADVWCRAGQVPLERIVMDPAPGTATVDDAIYSKERLDLSCELVDGILVAKTMGYFESTISAALVYFLHLYIESNPIGVVSGGDGPCDTLPNHVRKPDAAVTLFERIRKLGTSPWKKLPFSPDLVVEVLSPSNTAAEMDMKLKEYFATGARLVWHIEPELRTARVFTAVDRYEDVSPDGALRGGDVLPGFELPLERLFAKAGPRTSGE